MWEKKDEIVWEVILLFCFQNDVLLNLVFEVGYNVFLNKKGNNEQ